MRESLYNSKNESARRLIIEGDPSSIIRANEAAALHRAIELAIESAFSYGIDLPVGAVALQGSMIIGRGFAGDNRLGNPTLHAEKMAVLDTRFDVWGGAPDTVVVTLEPCEKCQDFLARESGIKRVAFGLARSDVAEKGLIKAHDEDIFERAKRLGLPYEVSQVEDGQLRKAGLTILDYVRRYSGTGFVEVDTNGLNRALNELNSQ